MNLLKKFARENLDNEADDFDSLYMGDETDNGLDEEVQENNRNIDFKHNAGSEKVSLKLLQPTSHKEAPAIADKLKEGSIVLLDIGNLSKEQARRLVDFLAGVAYVLGGEMIKSNNHTIIVSPAGVDISGFAAENGMDDGRFHAEEDHNSEQF